jgi:hypothetical protein
MLKYESQAVGIMKKLLYRKAKIELNDDFPLISTENINNNRYAIIKYLSTITGRSVKYAILFKKQRFHSFGKIFEDKGEYGEGETINEDDYNNSLNKTNEIYFLYQNNRNIELVSIKPERIEKLKESGKVYIYTNKSDNKRELIFNCKWLRYE